MTLDDLRARFPLFGFAIFAMDPAELVTLEVYEPGGQTFQWRGASVEAVLAAAFPVPVVLQTPSAVGLVPAVRPTLDPPDKVVEAGGVAKTTGSVFD